MLTVALISNGYGDNARSPVTHESLSTSLVYWFAAHRFRTSAVHQNIVVKNGTVCCWEICKSQKMSVPEFSNTLPLDCSSVVSPYGCAGSNSRPLRLPYVPLMFSSSRLTI